MAKHEDIKHVGAEVRQSITKVHLQLDCERKVKSVSRAKSVPVLE
jgi:hypothetical protein